MQDLDPDKLKHLLNRIATKDDAAVMALYRHYHGFVHAFVRMQLRDEHLVEETVQDVFVAICQKPLAFDGRSRFSTYLCSVARFKAIDALRRQGPEHIPLDTDSNEEHPALQVADDAPSADPTQVLQAAQNEAWLRHCMDKLPEPQRLAFFWTYYGDAPEHEVAERCACQVGTVKSRLFHARQALKRCLARWTKEMGYA